MTTELVKRVSEVKDYQIKRVFWDVVNNTDCYSTNWIKTDGIPYWKMILKGNKNVKGNPEAQVMIDLYKQVIKNK
jgi:hypothetical protein